MSMTTPRASGALLLSMTLAACGGGGGDSASVQEITSPDVLAFNVGQGDPSDLSATFYIANQESTGTRTGGTLTRVSIGPDEISGLSGLNGDINDARTQITLSGGGAVDLRNPINTEFMRFFNTNFTTGDQWTGIVGIPSSNADVASATATYTAGRAEVIIVDGNQSYNAVGSAQVNADFVGRSVDVEITNLREGGGPSLVDVTIDNASISGNSYSGGQLSLSNSSLDNSSTNNSVQHNGQFYGPGADEVGGAFVYDRQTQDDLLIQGVYASD